MYSHGIGAHRALPVMAITVRRFVKEMMTAELATKEELAGKCKGIIHHWGNASLLCSNRPSEVARQGSPFARI